MNLYAVYGKEMPKYWDSRIIHPIFKKGNKEECANYREIMLLSVPYKILSAILLKRLEINSEELLNGYQCGFHSGKETIDQIFTV